MSQDGRATRIEDSAERVGTHAPGAPVVRPADVVAARDVAAGTATRMQVLVGPGEGAPNFVLRRFIMDAGGGMPLHTNEVEHEQYVLRGRARIRVGDSVHEVAADHTLYIPAGVPHSYDVIEAPFEFLCVVPNSPDRIELADDRSMSE
jgi:quercetin dioxygenase-like cupin family protein